MSYKPNETLLLKYLGASPILRIVDFFLDNPLSDYSKNEIVRNLAMSRVTFFKYWKELERSGALSVTRKIGRATMYKLDGQNDVVKQLIKLDMALARTSMYATVERLNPASMHSSKQTVRPERQVKVRNRGAGRSARTVAAVS